jgi:hypothetical protein
MFFNKLSQLFIVESLLIINGESIFDGAVQKLQNFWHFIATVVS